MYAIIETGGKQYTVRQGDVLFIDKIAAEEGDIVTFDRVLALSKEGAVSFGTPLLEDVKVEGRVLGHGKHKKIIVFKYKPKKNYRRKQGHRQPYTRVQIERIIAGETAETEAEAHAGAESEVQAGAEALAEIEN